MGGPRRRSGDEDAHAAGEANTDFANTELPEPPARWTEENLPTLPPDVRYEVLEEIGRGGMGKVMRAHDRRLDRPIAMKSLLGGREHVTRFLHEARITARLEHPGVVPVHDAGRLASGEPFYAMKLIGGRSLNEAINAAQELGGRLALLGAIIDVAYAVAYAHSKGVIHRDLKPENVLVGEFGETLVIDWGLSKEIGRDAKRSGGLRRISEPMETVDGSVMGTPAYMPPEQARGEALDARTDVYAIGALLYALLTGQAPHEGRTKVEILAAARGKTPRAIRELAPDAPADLVAIAEAAMAFDREARYPGALELADDLKRFQTGRLVAARAYRMRELVLHWVRRHYRLVVLAALSALVVGAIGIISVARIVSARHVAESERNRAQVREREAQERAAQLMLAEARAQLAQDPTTALVGLKRLLASPAADIVALEDVRLTAAEAVSRGVIRHVMLGHKSEVTQLEVSEHTAYSFSRDGTLRVWDVESGHARGQADQVAGHVFAFARAADGVLATAEADGIVLRDRAAHVVRRLATGVAMHAVIVTPTQVIGGGDDGRVQVWPRAGGDAFTLRLDAPITALALAGDGGVAIGTARGTVAIWKPPGDKVLASVDLADRIARLAVDHAGRVTVVADHQFAEWQPRDGAVQKHASDNASEFDIAISNDDRWLGTANGHEARIIDRNSAAAPLVYESVDSIAFSPAGTLAALAQRDGLLLHDLATGIDIKLPLFRNASSVRFDGNDRVIVGGVDGEVFVFDLAPIVPANTWSIGSAVRAVRTSRDGRTLAAFTLDRKFVELDLTTKALSSATVNGKIRGIAPATEPRTWWLATDRGIVRSSFATGIQEPIVTNIVATSCLSSSGDLLVYAEDQYLVHVRDLASGTDRPLGGVTYTAQCELDGKAIVIGDSGGHLRRIEVATGTTLAEDNSHSGLISRMAILPDGVVVTASTDGTARLWRGNKSTVLTRHGVPAWGVSAVGQLAASSGSDRAVRISDLDGRIVRILRGHGDDVSGVALAPDGSWIASSSMDGTVRLWMIGNDSPPHNARALARWLDAHTSMKPVD
jgi:eukaryotic-like serine/threonine-protein kinase